MNQTDSQSGRLRPRVIQEAQHTVSAQDRTHPLTIALTGLLVQKMRSGREELELAAACNAQNARAHLELKKERGYVH